VTLRRSAIIGAAVGLTVSMAILSLLWVHMWGILVLRQVNIRHIFWPSSVMLTSDWCRSARGILITISSVAINSCIYAGVAVGLRALVRLTRVGPLSSN
jgi:hypothetical protein